MIYVYAILNVIVYIYESFLINFTNNTINKTGIAKETIHTNIITINGAITFKRENIDNKKNIAIMPKKVNVTINIFFNIFPSLLHREIISCLRRFCKYSVFLELKIKFYKYYKYPCYKRNERQQYRR